MHIGTVIKMERLRQDIKQETLAKGICSAPYLSRIENGNIKPSEVIVDMLSTKLGIRLVKGGDFKQSLPEIDLDQIIQRCITVINLRDQVGVLQLIGELSALLQNEELDPQLRINLQLAVLRLRLVSKDNAGEVLQEIIKYEEIESSLTPLQLFRVHMMAGMARYGCGDITGCLVAFSKASAIVELVSLTRFERADFSYVQAVVLIMIAEKFEALERARYSLSYFKSEMASHRVVECLVICGMAYKQMGQYDKAIEQLREAERICTQFQMDSFFGMIFQNLGDAYSVKGEADFAVIAFQQAMAHKTQAEEIIYSIFSLVKEYTNLEEPREIEYWLQEGYGLFPSLSEQTKILFGKHFDVYRALYEGDKEQIEHTLVEAFNFFHQKGKRKQTETYAKKLAEFYTSIGRYKKAVSYYAVIVG